MNLFKSLDKRCKTKRCSTLVITDWMYGYRETFRDYAFTTFHFIKNPNKTWLQQNQEAWLMIMLQPSPIRCRLSLWIRLLLFPIGQWGKRMVSSHADLKDLASRKDKVDFDENWVAINFDEALKWRKERKERFIYKRNLGESLTSLEHPLTLKSLSRFSNLRVLWITLFASDFSVAQLVKHQTANPWRSKFRILT